jgi:hypothetical protein
MNCNIDLSTDGELVITRVHKTGETILVVSEQDFFMVSFSSNEHPNKGWRKQCIGQEIGIPAIFELFNKED